jgi:predicted Fe-Mo cluster-binding NifX family protein
MGKKGMNEIIGSGFENTSSYTILNTENDEISIVENYGTIIERQNKLSDILVKNDVKIIICGGLSNKFIQIFKTLGIRIFIGASGTVRETLQHLRNGELQEIKN